MTYQRKFAYVALHDKEMVMATGDITGRNIVWHRFTELLDPSKLVYHWHTPPVNALCFSTEGILIIFYLCVRNTSAFLILPVRNAEVGY